MNRPAFQRIALAVAYILAGIAVAGSILDAISNSLQLVTPRVATIATATIVVVLGVIEVAARVTRFRWNFPGIATSRVTGLGSRWFLGAVGVIVTLWVPTLVSRIHPPPLPVDPLRYRYVTLDSGEARLFVARRIPEAWRPEISRDAFIVPNEPFVSLQKLVPPMSEKALTSDGIRLEPALAARQQAVSWIETTSRQRQSSLASDDTWNAFLTDWFHDPEKLTFWRYSHGGDFALFRSQDPEWIDFDWKLGAWHPPPDFAFLYTSEAECEGVPIMVLVPRTVHLRLLVIENASKDAVDIGTITFHPQEKPYFRLPDQDEQLANTSRLESRALLPAGKLLPGEKLIIPLQIVFRFEGDDFIFYARSQSSQDRRTRYEAKITAEPDSLFDVGGDYADVRLSGSRLSSILIRDDREPDLGDEIIAGPSVKVVSVVSDGVVHKIRSFNPEQVVINGPSGEGSCPFVLTRAGKNERWRREGVILKNNRGAANAGTDTRMLERFDGRVVLQELEPEVTTLDRAFIRAILPGGRTREFAARDPVLRAVDGAVAAVSPHHPLAIDFDVPAPIPGARYELVVHGYFTPYQRRP